MIQEGQVFKYLTDKFSRLSVAKFKEGIFVGPPFRQLAKNPAFVLVLKGKEKEAWEAFKAWVFWATKEIIITLYWWTILLQKNTINSDATCPLKSIFSTPTQTYCFKVVEQSVKNSIRVFR